MLPLLHAPSAIHATAEPGQPAAVELGTVFDWRELTPMFRYTVRHVGLSHRKKLKQRMVEANPHCHYCGRQLGKGRKSTLDHFRPASRGGSINGDANLKLCCRSCNASKASMTPEEWLAALESTVAAVRHAILMEGEFSPVLEPEPELVAPVKRGAGVNSIRRRLLEIDPHCSHCGRGLQASDPDDKDSYACVVRLTCELSCWDCLPIITGLWQAHSDPRSYLDVSPSSVESGVSA